MITQNTVDKLLQGNIPGDAGPYLLGEKGLKAYVFLFLLSLSIGGCAGYRVTFFGVALQDGGMPLVGAMSSIATHIAGHWIAAELTGTRMSQHGPLEKIHDYKNVSDPNLKWVAMSGFYSQAVINSLLVCWDKKSPFTKGYTAATATELWSYRFRIDDDEMGDFYLYDFAGGNSDSVFAQLFLVSVYNSYQVSIAKDPSGL